MARTTFERDRAAWALHQERLAREAREQRIALLEQALAAVVPIMSEQAIVTRDLRRVEAEFSRFRTTDGFLALDSVSRVAAKIAPAGSRRRRAVEAFWRAARPSASKCVRLIQGGGRRDPNLPADPTGPVHDKPRKNYTGYRGLRKVVFLIGCVEGESSRYRVKNLVEALEELGVEALIIYEALDLEHPEAITPADLLVLFRAAWSDRLGRIVSRYRVLGARIVFDVDDLVFDRRVVEFVDPVKRMNEAERANYIDGVTRYRQTVISADHCTTTTEYLAERLRGVGRTVSVIPNTISDAQLRVSEQPADKPIAGGRPVIGYLSGTHTHNKDFLQAADALLEILAERDVVLCIVGELTLDARFEAHAHRIVRAEFMPHLEMLQFCKGFAINIAPLELDNPFNHGKSELKIFEAGLVRVPTVASAIDSYARLIRNGENGFLARTKPEWKSALLRLLDEPELRSRVGDTIRQESIDKFLIHHVIDEVVDHFLDIKSKRGVRDDLSQPGDSQGT